MKWSVGMDKELGGLGSGSEYPQPGKGAKPPNTLNFKTYFQLEMLQN